MRHFLANIFTYALVTGLILGAALFAWARSEQLVIARELDVEPEIFMDRASPVTADWFDFGRQTYRVSCQNCHTGDGSGRGMYPPIQQMVSHLSAKGGRAYLIDLTLYGLYTGTYGAPMPPMPELSDAEIAAVTNYMLIQFAAKGKEPDTSQLYVAREVAARRGQVLSEWDVANRRPPIPSAEVLGQGVRVPRSNESSAVPEGKDE